MSKALDCSFHEEHMWVRQDGDEGVLGISDFAQEKLGEVSLIVAPDPGTKITQGLSLGTAESAKAASDLIAPVTGEVVAVNPKLEEDPWLVNDEPYGDGWIVRIRLADAEELGALFSEKDYIEKVGGQ